MVLLNCCTDLVHGDSGHVAAGLHDDDDDDEEEEVVDDTPTYFTCMPENKGKQCGPGK